MAYVPEQNLEELEAIRVRGHRVRPIYYYNNKPISKEEYYKGIQPIIDKYKPTVDNLKSQIEQAENQLKQLKRQYSNILDERSKEIANLGYKVVWR